MMMACLSAEAMARIARVKKRAYFMELFEGGMVLDTNPTPVLVQPMEIECLHNAHIHYSAAGQGLYDTYEGGESFHRNNCRERK